MALEKTPGGGLRMVGRSYHLSDTGTSSASAAGIVFTQSPPDGKRGVDVIANAVNDFGRGRQVYFTLSVEELADLIKLAVAK